MVSAPDTSIDAGRMVSPAPVDRGLDTVDLPAHGSYAA